MPCTWLAQKQGSREEVLIMLDKKEKVDSHLGLKVRKSKRQKDHEMQLVSWEKHQARYEQQQQHGGAHGPVLPPPP